MNPTVRTIYNPRRATPRRGFTLIELLVVIAVTAVLFALLLVPLVSALRYTQQAQIVAAAQDAARSTKEGLTRELSSAAFVFDGTSHPFKVPTGTTPTASDDRYTNFLDLQILDKAGSPVVAHAYSAKLDFVMPKLNDTNATIDPTTNEPISYRPTNGSALIGSPSLVFPPAAGTTMIRYFVGLKDPTKSYNNTREGKSITGDDNTYILYRAQFLPYKPVTDANGNVTGVTPNTDLFATRPQTGNPNQLIPELDDPDFFRYVSIKPDGTPATTLTDVNWLDDTHGTYPGQTDLKLVKNGTVTAPDVNPDGSAAQHNYRVENWRKIAKPVIPGPNVDLLLLPHNSDNTLAYDTAGTFAGIAHSGTAHDPVPAQGKDYPIVNTSVTFRPATVSGNATPGTTTDYTSAGVTVSDQTGYTYIPTVYTATNQSWSLPFHVSLYPSNFDAASTNVGLRTYYDTEASAYTDAATPPLVFAGDILEYSNDAKTGARTLVYNVTQEAAVTQPTATTYAYGGTQSVPMAINPDTGTINFAVPSLPAPPTDTQYRYKRLWYYTPAADATVDLTQPGFTDASLTIPSTTSPLGTIVNAHIAPGSVRVYGPDTKPGASNGGLVSYTEINVDSPGTTGLVGENQFSVDYLTGKVQLYSDPSTGPVAPIGIIYDYQANMTLNAPGTAFNADSNQYQPMQVKVDYQTRDLIDATIGVRIYDITTNRAQVIPAETKIKIGNSNR